MKDLKNHLIIFAGPTGVGKTEIGIEFARRHNAEIISADSMQIYKGLHIGTAKPTPQEMAAIPHHLVDCWDNMTHFNLSNFIELADRAIADIRERGKNCVIVGGTGMYIEGLIKGIFSEPSKDAETRIKLEKRGADEGIAALYTELNSIDPEIAKKIESNDSIRIIRALEVYYVTGKNMSYWQEESRKTGDRYSYQLFILDRQRNELYSRINKRVDKMFAEGFVEEVRALIQQGLNSEHQCMKAVGYREILKSLTEGTDPEEMKEKIKQSSRNYAKRQLTWFRNRLPGKQIMLTGKTIQIILDEIDKYIEINM